MFTEEIHFRHNDEIKVLFRTVRDSKRVIIFKKFQ